MHPLWNVPLTPGACSCSGHSGLEGSWTWHQEVLSVVILGDLLVPHQCPGRWGACVSCMWLSGYPSEPRPRRTSQTSSVPLTLTGFWFVLGPIAGVQPNGLLCGCGLHVCGSACDRPWDPQWAKHRQPMTLLKVEKMSVGSINKRIVTKSLWG